MSRLRPGDYTWHPERQRHGPVAIIVSLPQQLVHVYRNGVRIAVSTCSSGKSGHETPTGIFVILQKDRDHRSSTYNNAPMPNMNRLTWSGVALHAGNLPGYPASHGCVRLPLRFSERLFTITQLGTPVIISGAPDDPWDLTHPGLVLTGIAAGQLSQIVATNRPKRTPSDWIAAERAPVASVVASSGDRKIILIENGVVVAEAGLTATGPGAAGDHVFMLQQPDSRGISDELQWIDITGTSRSRTSFHGSQDILGGLRTTPAFASKLKSVMREGMILVLTSAPLHPDSRSGEDFVIMTL